MAFRVLTGGALPDFRTVSEFRKRHLPLLEDLFVQVLRLCREAGLVRVGHLSVDGSTYQANASKHKAMSYGRMQEVEPRLEQEIRDLLRQAQAVDAAEDVAYGANERCDDVPQALRRREERLEKIRAAKARLEERARQRARARGAARGASDEELAEAVARAVPGPKEQSSFTDPESRIMKTKTGWTQAYNAQVAVEEASGVIVAQEVSAHGTDSPRLRPMLDQVTVCLTAVGVPPDEQTSGVFSADAGYCSEANLAELAARGIDAYVATGRERHPRQGVDPPEKTRRPLRTAMRATLQTEEGHAIYARRTTRGGSASPSRCMVSSSRPAASVSFCCGAWSRSRVSSPCWR